MGKAKVAQLDYPFTFYLTLPRPTSSLPTFRPQGQGIKLKGYYPYFGVQPFTFASKYFATLQKGSGNFFVNPSK